jgi:hypothetical protein
VTGAPGYEPQGRVRRLRAAVRARGALPVTRDITRWAFHAATGWSRSRPGARGDGATFSLGGEPHPYLRHRHKLTWLTERGVEVPVVRSIVERHAGQRVLEVGNVLAHYGATDHLVIDKYEQAPGVLNRDVLEPGEIGPFDLIVAISTLEHVGWDEHPRDPGKAPAAVRRLVQLLAPAGTLVLTVPVGYNEAFDRALRDGAIPVTRTLAMKRSAPGPHWHEVPAAEAWRVPYDFLLYSAGAVVFAFIESEPAG